MYEENFALFKDVTFAFQWQTKNDEAWAQPKVDDDVSGGDTINNKNSISKGKTEQLNQDGAEIGFHVFLLSEFPVYFCLDTTHKYLNLWMCAFMEALKTDTVVKKIYSSALSEIQKNIELIFEKAQKAVKYTANDGMQSEGFSPSEVDISVGLAVVVKFNSGTISSPVDASPSSVNDSLVKSPNSKVLLAVCGLSCCILSCNNFTNHRNSPSYFLFPTDYPGPNYVRSTARCDSSPQSESSTIFTVTILPLIEGFISSIAITTVDIVQLLKRSQDKKNTLGLRCNPCSMDMTDFGATLPFATTGQISAQHQSTIDQNNSYNFAKLAAEFTSKLEEALSKCYTLRSAVLCLMEQLNPLQASKTIYKWSLEEPQKLSILLINFGRTPLYKKLPSPDCVFSNSSLLKEPQSTTISNNENNNVTISANDLCDKQYDVFGRKYERNSHRFQVIEFSGIFPQTGAGTFSVASTPTSGHDLSCSSARNSGIFSGSQTTPTVVDGENLTPP